MGKLPEIQYQQASLARLETQNAAAPYKAAAGLADTLAEGLTAIGQEMVKTEQQKADLDLREKLTAVSADLTKKPSMKAEEVREQLGDEIPPELEQFLTKPDGTDNEDIPTWRVAGAIYDAQAKKAVEGSAGGISTGPGWTGEFKRRAAGAVLDAKVRLNEDQMRAQQQWQRSEQDNLFQRALRMGAWDDASKAATSGVWTGPEKDKKLLEIRENQQTKPVYDAIRSNDEGELRAQRAMLEDDKKFDAVDAERRASLADRLDSQLRSIAHEKKTAEANIRKMNAVKYWDNLLQAEMSAKKVGQRADSSWYEKYLPKNANEVEDEDGRQMLSFIESRIKGEPIQTDKYVYHLLGAAQQDREHWKKGEININALKPDAPPKYVTLFAFRNKLSDGDWQVWSDRINSTGLAEDPRSASAVTPLGVAHNVLQGKYKLDPKKMEKTASGAAALGEVEIAIDTALAQATAANQGKRLTPEQENKVAEDTIHGMMSQPEKRSLFGLVNWETSPELMKTGRPALAQAMRMHAQRQGVKLTLPQIQDRIADYDKFLPGIETEWRKRRGDRVLTEAESLGVMDYIYKNHAAMAADIPGFDEMSPEKQREVMARIAVVKHLGRK